MITKLTPEQTAKFPEYVRKWLDIGLSTAPLDRNAASKAIDEVYKAVGKKPPAIKVFLDSPFGGAIGAVYLKNWKDSGDQVRDQVWAQVWDQVWDQVGAQVRDQVWDQVRDQVGDQVGAQVWDQVRAQVGDQVWDQVGDQVGDQVWDQVGDQVWDQVGDQVRAQVGDQVWDQVRDQVRDQVWDQVRAQVGDQVWDQVRDQVWDQVGAQVRDQVGDQVGDQVWDQVGAQVSTAGYGSHDSNWLAFYEFFQKETQLKCCDKLNGLMEAAKAMGWFWPFENAVIITPRPVSIKMDDQNRIHCEDGPAILYPDGWGVYAWHGTRIPEEWVKDKASITPDIALNHPNTEQRRCAMEILGYEKLLKKLDAKLIDQDPDPTIGQLYETRHKSLGGNKEKFLRVKCGTGRYFAIPVPPEMKTALEANSWTWGLKPEQYLPEIRT